MEPKLTQKQAQSFARVINRNNLRDTEEQTAAFLATEEGQRIAKLIEEYKAKMGYK